MSIGKAANLIGVHPDTLRSWEKAGRIKSVRTKGNHRRFHIDDVEKASDIHEKCSLWDHFLSSNEEALNKWFRFYEDNDPVFSEIMDYAKSRTQDRELCLKVCLLGMLDKQVHDRTPSISW